jgi:hypothetical protein
MEFRNEALFAGGRRVTVLAVREPTKRSDGSLPAAPEAVAGRLKIIAADGRKA